MFQHAATCDANCTPEENAAQAMVVIGPTFDALAAAQAEIAALKGLLYRWQQSGCPHCPGDCAGANPPSATCIVRATAAALESPKP